jgi:Flp pilus assembly protein TadB
MNKKTGFAEGLNEAVRENPVAAALVGAGVVWMLFGSKMPALAAAVPDAAKSVGQSLSSAGHTTVDAISGAANNVKRQVTDAVDRTTDAARELSDTTDTVSKAASDTGDKMAEIARDAVQSGQRYMSAAQQRL